MLCFVFMVNKTEGQELYPYKYKNEVSIDATAVIGNLLSLNSERAKSPYGFGYRHHFNKYSLRVRGNTLLDNRTILEFDGNRFNERKIAEQEHSLSLAFEKGIDVAKNFRLLYGADILFGYTFVNTQVENVFERINQDITMGFGPALRLEYRISDRFLLTTESTLYGKMIISDDRFKLGFDPEQVATSTSYNVLLALPTSLTFSIGF